MNKNRAFFKENKKEFVDIVSLPISQAFVDEKGNLIEWVFKRIDSATDNALIRASMELSKETNGYIFNEQDYMLRYLTKACVYPDLTDAELANSYGVELPSHVLLALLDDPVEYKMAFQLVQMAFREKKIVNDDFEEVTE